jgi:PD-(D/E)XK nuclease superfamily
MKTINTLIEDIKELVKSPSDTTSFDGGYWDALGSQFATTIQGRLAPEPEANETVQLKGSLRFSNLGVNCKRQLWYRVNTPNDGEGLLPNAKIKFLYGDLLEILLLHLVRAAGHSVEGEQTTLELQGIKGHRDCIVDGMVIDCKSASSFSFRKFELGLTPETDSFGYLTQLGLYLAASRDDPLVTYKNEAAFLVVDKTTGDILLDRHTYTDEQLDKLSGPFIEEAKIITSSPELPPRGFSDVPDGKSGNRKLDTNCSYCQFKDLCWPDLKVYAYAGAPRFLTNVVVEPKVERTF